MTTSKTGRIYLAAAGYTAIIGLSFLFVKMALQTADPLDILAHRFTLSLIATGIVLLTARRRLHFTGKEWLAILPLALFYPFLFFTLQTFGLVYTTSGEAGIVNATAPIFTMLLASFFLKERSTWLQKLFTLLTVGGVVFIFLMKGVQFKASGSLGILLILLSALSLASYSVLARKLTQRFHYLDLTFIIMLVGFVVFNLMSLVRHVGEGTLAHYFDPFSTPSFLWAVLYIGVLSSMGSSLLSNYVLSHMEASRMSLFNNVATVITLIAGVFVLNEEFAYYHVVGAAMVIAGVIGVNLAGRRTRSAKRPVLSKVAKVEEV